MEFLILGPLEVRDAGHALDLPGARQRALLALLLLHVDQVVSRDRLIEELWGQTPPDSAPAMVQVYVSRLRKALPADTLITQAPGYRIRAEPEQVDARRFERLLDEGRRVHAAGDAPRAATLLREALDLWRGPALVDFAYEDFAQSEIARLEELRLAALEARVEADLETGRHLDLVGELEALVGAHPLRERLRGHLMLALYRCGRQAEALAAYRDARATLVDQLGIEPSPALQRLERGILTQDPALEPFERARPRPEPAPASAAAPEPAPPEEVRRLVTVLFTGVAGSSEFGGPERLRRVMERLFDTASGVVARHGGTIDAFVGDSVSAVFGVPTVHEDDALRALRAALELREAVSELNDELQQRWGRRIAIRTGVSTGEAMTGGARGRQGLATGDVVVMARRLQEASGAGEILVSERTAAAVRGGFELSDPGGGAVPARRVLRALSRARPRGGTGRGPVFVGREPELALLEGTYRRVVSDGGPHVVTVLGDPGVGKTTLLRELRERLAGGDPAPRLRVGRCPSYGRGISYWPLGEILREELGLREGEPPERLRERLHGREILGLSLGLDAPPELHPVAARERLHAEWVAFLDELAAERPAVLVVEDLNWAEDPLLDLLEHLARSVRGPLLLLVTARPELLDRRPAWGAGRGNTMTLRLEPLPSGDAERMLAGLAGTDIAPELRDLVLARSEGNPFYLEELVATLVDRGVFARDGGAALPADFAIPDSVQAVLAARMELLAPAERAALQTAAVIGRVFWEGPVRELLGDIEPDLSILEERGFIRRRATSTLQEEREYAFKHVLTCEIARAALPTPRRARLHARFAAWIEQAGFGADEQAPLLAHHYAESVRPADADIAWEGADDEVARLRASAVRWLRRAAELATGRCAVEDAVGLLRRALELEADPAGEAELWRRVAQASALGYDGESFFPAMERAIALTSDAGDLAELYSELALETTIRPAMWLTEPDRGRVDGAIERALRLTRGRRTPARVRALVAKSCSEPTRDAGEALEASALADGLDDARLQSQARGAEFKAAFARGRLEEAMDAAHRRLELEAAVSDPEERGFMHWDLALAALATGRVDDAVGEARRHDEMVAHLSAHHAVHGAGLLVMVHELGGHWDAIGALQPDAESAVVANPAAGCTFNARTLLACALAAAHAGDDALARRLEAAADAFEPVGYGLTALTPRLRLALLRRDLDAVERMLAAEGEPMYFAWLDSEAARLDALAAIGDRARLEAAAPPLLQPGSYLEPFALRALGVVREDESLLQRAIESYEVLGLEWHARETRALVTAGPGSSARP